MESTRREMWENAGFSPDNFTAAAEISQYRDQVILQTETYLGNIFRKDSQVLQQKRHFLRQRW